MKKFLMKWFLRNKAQDDGRQADDSLKQSPNIGGGKKRSELSDRSDKSDKSDRSDGSGWSEEEEEPLTELQLQLGRVAAQVDDLMWFEKSFLDPDLRISDVAKAIGSNDKYVSLAVNEILGYTFTEYINRLRMGHAKKLQRNQPDLPLSEVARLSGYNSLNTFYRNRKLYGEGKH